MKATVQTQVFEDKRKQYLEGIVMGQISEVVSKKKTEQMSAATAAYTEGKDKIAAIHARIEEQSRVQAPPATQADAAASKKGPQTKVVRYFPLVKKVGRKPAAVAAGPLKFTYNFECKSLASDDQEK